MLSWQPISGAKLAKSAYSPSFVAFAFQNGMEYRNSDFKRFNGDYLATSCKNLVNFGPVTPEFKRVKGVHPLVDQQFSYVHLAAPPLDTARSVPSFVARSVLSFVSPILWGGGVTAMPRGLHARLCRAFLLNYAITS